MIPKDLKYTKDHEWTRVEGNTITVGITFHAQKELGDIVYVELPKPGTALNAHQPLGVVESTKATSDIYSPVSGKVVAVNEELTKAPQLCNEDPYGKAWMVKLELSKPAELTSLLDDKAYDALLKQTTK